VEALSSKVAVQELSPALLDACRRGDRRALEDVLTRHTPDLERLIVRMIGPRADVDDVMQTALMAIVSAFPRYRGEAWLRTWMTRITVNVVRDYHRQPHHRRVVLQMVPGTPGENEAEDRDLPDQQAMGRRQLERVYDHLAAIGPKKRLAFVLHVFEGFPIDEVAALTGATQAATKSRIFWARRALLGKARKDPLLRELLGESEAEA
jgi:RNA polymerase sigma-70 factor, ECF subfamily